jgi:hypothetical protein
LLIFAFPLLAQPQIQLFAFELPKLFPLTHRRHIEDSQQNANRSTHYRKRCLRKIGKPQNLRDNKSRRTFYILGSSCVLLFLRSGHPHLIYAESREQFSDVLRMLLNRRGMLYDSLAYITFEPFPPLQIDPLKICFDFGLTHLRFSPLQKG